MLNKISKINKIEMVRSDISGKLFPADECEMVVIKIIKAKFEDINGYNPIVNNLPRFPQEGDRIPSVPSVPLTPPLLDPASPEYNKIIHRKQSIIPPSMKDIFNKPPEVQ